MRRFTWLLLCLLLASCGDPPVETPPKVRVGVLLPLDGPDNGMGSAVIAGLRQRTHEANLDNDLGMQITFSQRGSQLGLAKAASMCREFSEDESVQAIIGPVLSNVGIAAMPVFEELKIPIISLCSGNALPRASEYVFQLAANHTQQAAALAAFAVKQRGLLKAAILVDESSESDKELAEAFATAYHARGGEIVLREKIRGGRGSFLGNIKAAKKAEVELVLLACQGGDLRVALANADLMDWDVPYCGGLNWDTREMALLGARALEDSFFCALTVNDGRNQDKVDAFAAREAEFATYSALGYDAMDVLIQALKTAGLEREKIAESLAAQVPRRLVSGAHAWDKDGQSLRQPLIVGYELRDLSYVRVQLWPRAEDSEK